MIQLSALALVAAGFVAAVAQVLITRELLNVFYGDELCIGLGLSAWLLWEAVGALIGAIGRRRIDLRPAATYFALLQAAIPLLLFLQIWAIRSTPFLLTKLHDSLAGSPAGRAGTRAFLASLLPTTQGDIIGIVPMVLVTLLLTAPACILLGVQFTMGARVYARARSAGVEAVGRSYVWDSVGHLGGGALLSCVFIYAVTPLKLALMAGAAALLIAALMLQWTRPPSRVVAPLVVGLPIVFALAGLSGLPDSLRGRTLRVRWGAHRLVASMDTPYGSLTCTEQGGQFSFFGNGLLMFENPARVVDEWTVHVPMLEVAKPRRVLLIGGGIGGGLYEALKHKPEQIDYVELDPWLIDFAEPFVTAKDADALHHKRVKTHRVDARLFVKQACATGMTYDVIIVSLPDPFTAQLSRFYTTEFFREARQCLSTNGVLAFHMASSSDYIHGALLDYNVCLYRTAAACLADVRVIPGDTATVLASPTKGVLTLDWRTLLHRLHARGIQTEELAYLLQDRLQPSRLQYVARQLWQAPPVRLNSDFAPIGYYYRQAMSATWFHPGAQRFFATLGRLTIWHVVLLVAASLIVLLPFADARAPMLVYAPAAVGAAGMASIILEMVLILAFETLYGYVYHKIGLLFGAFMVGLALGGTWMSGHLAQTNRPLRAMAHIQLAAAAVAAAIPPILLTLASPSKPAAVFMVVDVLFPALVALIGVTVGAVFTAAGQARKLATDRVGSRAGFLYSADLLGACVGALVATLLLIPVLGIPLTCIAAACLDVGFVVVLLVYIGVRRPT